MSGAVTLDTLVSTLACLTSMAGSRSSLTVNSNSPDNFFNTSLGCPPMTVSFLNFEIRDLRNREQQLLEYLEKMDRKLNHLSQRQSFLESHQPVLKKSCIDQPSGFNPIQVNNIGNLIVRCEQNLGIYQGDWLQIANRESGQVNFLRPWEEYKNGFGALQLEFFIGLQALHEITSSHLQELLIYLEKSSGESAYAHYDLFSIGSEFEKYALKLLGKYSGTAGDALSYHAGQPFTTIDMDNDKFLQHNCANIHSGAWWYSECYQSNLFGLYQKPGDEEVSDFKGILWNGFFNGPKGSLKTVRMYVRPKVKKMK